MQAAGALGDPWATVVPGAYADGTAGAALGRLNNTPPDAPVAVIPGPSNDATLCVVYLYTELITGEQRENLKVNFQLSGPGKADRALESAPVSMITDEEGFAQISLRRTDQIEPEGRYYLVNCPALGLRDAQLTLDEDLKDLADLIG